MSKSRKKKAPKRVLALPDLEQAKSAVLNTHASVSGQRTYDHAINDFVEWYCSEPRLAFNRTVVLRYRITIMSALLRTVPALTGHHTWPTSSGQTHRPAHTTTGRSPPASRFSRKPISKPRMFRRIAMH